MCIACGTLTHCQAQVLPPGASKGVGVGKLLEAMDIAPENVMALGDGENDVQMLQVGILVFSAHALAGCQSFDCLISPVRIHICPLLDQIATNTIFLRRWLELVCTWVMQWSWRVPPQKKAQRQTMKMEWRLQLRNLCSNRGASALRVQFLRAATDGFSVDF